MLKYFTFVGRNLVNGEVKNKSSEEMPKVLQKLCG